MRKIRSHANFQRELTARGKAWVAVVITGVILWCICCGAIGVIFS